MFFSFKNIPIGSKEQEVWIYSSEIEVQLSARLSSDKENRLFNLISGTMAQNHQKLFGCIKLASKVDLNFIRGMNCKLFKFIAKEKLRIEGVERVNILSPLGSWLLPFNRMDRSKTLLVFDNQLFSVDYPLPTFWSEEYSEQFRDVPLEKINDYIEAVGSDDQTPISSIRIAINQKFRKDLTKDYIEGVLRA